jgi:hypothetical protein
MAAPSVTLRGGAEMPALAWGSGTAWFRRDPGDLDAAVNPALQANVTEALRAGVRHLDAAEMCVPSSLGVVVVASRRALARCAAADARARRNDAQGTTTRRTWARRWARFCARAPWRATSSG